MSAAQQEVVLMMINQHLMDEETASIDEHHETDSDYQNDCESSSHYYPDNLFTKLKEKLTYRRPKRHTNLWVFGSPRDHSSCLPPSNSVGIQDKIKSALQLLDKPLPILIQFWAPVTTGGRCFLVTSEQPFGLYGNDERLSLYRNHSVDSKFVVDGKSKEVLGFPARVFGQKRPESTPFGQCHSTEQHPWCNPSLNFSELKLLALPVFEPSGECCVGVLELVASFLSLWEIEAVYTALEKVDLKSLRSWYCFDKEEISNEGLQQPLDEVMKVFEVVCDTYQLPLAQTWVPCKHCNAVACSSFPNKSPRVVLSKIDEPYYSVNFEAEQFFHETSYFHLQENQGVVGRAYLSHNSSFCRDITQFSSTEYPMVHYAREYQFSGCFAICLKSSYTGEDYYILEFFLPDEKRIDGHPWPQILDSILETMKQHLCSFKLASGEPLGVESVNFSVAEKHDFVPRSPPRSEALQNGGDTVLVNSSDQPMMVQDNAINNVRSIGSAEKSNIDGTYSGEKDTRKTSKREHEITREDLEQHFGRNTIEDCLKIFEVSRSTFKRICRDHKISRWPRCKNNSLSMQDSPCSDLPHVTAMQDVRMVAIKASYRDDIFIMFQLTSTAGLVELEEEIAKRLKLKVGCFSIKYRDKDNDLILLPCDEDLQFFLKSAIALGTTPIRLFVELNTI